MERMASGGDETTTVVDEADHTTKRLHPFRGLLWGFVFGIGLAGVLIVTTTITVSILSVIVVLVVGLAVGIAWGVFGPASKPKGPPPSTRVPVEQLPSSRSDDFGRPPTESPVAAAPAMAATAPAVDEPAPSDELAPPDPSTSSRAERSDDQRPG